MIVLIGFICIILLVIAHELGHYLAAKRNGIDVEEFGIGFPPRAKKLGKRDGTEFTLNWLPLGGFVKLKGEHDSDTEQGSFGAARLIDKVKVMVAGVGVNFFIAFILFTVIALIGMPQIVENQFTVERDTTVVRQDVLVGFVAEESPAEEAGMQDNDILRSITQISNCQADCQSFALSESDDLGQATSSLAGERVAIDLVRDGDEQTTQVQLLSEEQVQASLEQGENRGYLGVVPNEFTVQRSTWSAPIVGAGITAQFTVLTLEGLWSIITGLFQGDTTQATEQVTGFVGIGFIFSNASFFGYVFMLMIVAVISLSLAIMNTLPIPALDGGRLFVTLFYRLLNKPLTKQAEERIHGTGFAVLMVLFVLITIVDVQRFVL